MGEGIPAPQEKYKGRKVIVEIGGQLQGRGHDTTLLNQLDLPESDNPLYIGVDRNPRYLGTEAKDGAPGAAMMVANIEDPEFLEGSDDLDGQVDRLFIFNVLTDYDERYGSVKKDFYEKLLEKIARMLKPGGKAYLAEWYTPSMMGGLESSVRTPGLEFRLITDTKEILETLKHEGVKDEKLSDIRFFLNRAPYVDPANAFLLEVRRPEES